MLGVISENNSFIIPVTSEPHQIFQCVIPVDGRNIRLRFEVRYNPEAGYWWMSVTDDTTGKALLDSVPFLPARYPAGNILEQYDYLQIGSAFIVPQNDIDKDNWPDDSNMGRDFVLLWSGNIEE